jgi:hypothetical protein
MPSEQVSIRLTSQGGDQILRTLDQIGAAAQAQFRRAAEEARRFSNEAANLVNNPASKTTMQMRADAFAGVNDNRAAAASRAADIAAYGKTLDDLRAKYSPLYAAQRQYLSALAEIRSAEKSGALSRAESAAAIDRTKASFAAQVNTLRGVKAPLEEHSRSVGLARHEWINLSRQMQDVGVSLAGGQAPLTVLVQQGSQIADIFSSSPGGAGAAMKDFAGTIARYVLNPVSLLVAGSASAAYALYQWKAASDALSVSLNGLGRASGFTVAQANRVAIGAADRAGLSIASAQGLAGQYLGAGVSGAGVGGAIGLTRDFSRRLGLSLEDASKELASALADPARGADELAKKYGVVSFAEREHIKELAAVGDKAGATRLLLSELAKSLDRMRDPTTAWQKLLDGMSKRLSDFFTLGAKEFSESGALLNRRITGGPRSFSDVFGDIRRSAENAKKAQADIDAERTRDLNRLREDSAFATRSILARTYAEREAVAVERARVTTLRETHDAVKAGIAAESERAKLLAESARKVEDLGRTSSDSLALARASNPLERRKLEIEFARRDFLRENVPNAATPMAREFGTAATAARNVADALNGLAAAAGGRADGKIGRLIPLSEWRQAHAPYDAIINAEGTAKYGDPYNTSLGYMRSPKPLVDMTMAESLAWGDQVRRAQGLNSSAKGAFQITNTTQRDAMRALGLGGSDMFSPENQRAMADWIYKTQGLGAWEGLKKLDGARRLEVSRGANDNLRAQANAAFDKQDAEADYTARIKPQEDFAKAIRLSRDALDARIATLGMDERAVDEATKRQELMNEAIRQTGNILPEQKRRIEENAKAWADYQAQLRKANEVENRYKENLDTVRGAFSGTLGGGLKALAHGQDVGAAIEQSLSSTLDRVIDLQVSRLGESLLGKMGSTNGGLLGGIFGDLLGGDRTTAQMDVNAAVVNVNGGGGVPGGSGGGGLLDMVGGLFKSDNFSGQAPGAVGPFQETNFLDDIGAFFNIGQNASGTDNWRGGLTWVGERGPELLNLPRGSQVMPNAASIDYARNMARFAGAVSAGGGQAPAAAGGGDVHVNLIGAPEGTKVEKSKRSDGSLNVNVLLKSFEKHIASRMAQGAFDAPMARYGSRALPRAR